ncbi:MAG: VOC family protein [Planctomycetota bacterium]
MSATKVDVGPHLARRSFAAMMSDAVLGFFILRQHADAASDSTPGSATAGAPRGARIGHAHLHVRELERSTAFYTRILSLRVTEIVGGRFAFLSAGHHHHDLALQSIGRDAPDAPRGSPGLYHVAFEASDAGSFEELWRAAQAEGVQPAAVDHGISWALYFDDPDGNGVEIYLDRRHAPEGTALWRGQSSPLTPERVRQSIGAAE